MTTYADFRREFPDGEIPPHLLSAYDEARTTWALDLATATETPASPDTATGPDTLIRQGVTALLADPAGLRGILDELMTSTLRLHAAAEWEREDNYAFTEGTVGMLAAYLPDATPHQTAEICDHFDLEFDEIDTDHFPEPAWDTPDEQETPYSEKDHSQLTALLAQAEALLDPLRQEPPENWAGDDCWSLAYGLAELLEVPLTQDTDDEADEDPTATE